MKSFLNRIRSPENKTPLWKQIIYPFLMLCLGVFLGILSKYLDETPSNTLPPLVEILDFRNFLGRFAIWIFLAVCIAIYSRTALRAAINVFVFFAGMITSYYLYSNYIAGFFPRSYAMIWIGFTIISPLLAVLCWYAKGKGKLAVALSSGIIAVLFNMTFSYGFFYLTLISPLELIIFILGIVILRRPIKEFILMIGSGIGIAILLSIVFPFQLF